MEDLSTLIWLGIAVVWFLTRLLRRGAKKVAKTQREQTRQPRPTVSRPAAPAQTQRWPGGSQPEFSGRDGKGPPPIVPR